MTLCALMQHTLDRVKCVTSDEAYSKSDHTEQKPVGSLLFLPSIRSNYIYKLEDCFRRIIRLPHSIGKKYVDLACFIKSSITFLYDMQNIIFTLKRSKVLDYTYF